MQGISHTTSRQGQRVDIVPVVSRLLLYQDSAMEAQELERIRAFLSDPVKHGVPGLEVPQVISRMLPFAIVVLLYLVARRPRGWWLAAVALVYAGLLWTHTRAAFLALAGGLVVLALVQRRWLPVALAAASLVVSIGFVKAFPHIGPETSYTRAELEFLEDNAAANPGEDTDPLSTGESSLASHWRNLRDGVETVLEHPQGRGLGNAGVSAVRTGVDVKAGESSYTELGVDAGIAGAAAFVAWLVALLAGLWRRSAWLTAAVAAVAALGLQTDVIGVHWLAYVLFILAGAALTRPEPAL
jgi:hypothetical protein